MAKLSDCLKIHFGDPEDKFISDMIRAKAKSLSSNNRVTKDIAIKAVKDVISDFDNDSKSIRDQIERIEPEPVQMEKYAADNGPQYQVQESTGNIKSEKVDIPTGKEPLADNLKSMSQAKKKEKQDALYNNKRDKTPSYPGSLTRQRLHRAIAQVGDPDKAKITVPSNQKEKTLGKLAKAFGIKPVYFRTSDTATRVTGFYFPGTDEVFINLSSGAPINAVFGHELVHYIKDAHSDLYDYLVQEFEKNKKDYFLYVAKENVNREMAGLEKISEEKALEEFIADFANDSFQRVEFWDKLYKKSPSMFQNLVDSIKKIFGKIKSVLTRSEQYILDVDKAQNDLVKVIDEVMRRAEEGKTSSKTDSVDTNPSYMFAGPAAKGADKGKAFEAQQMRDAGVSREEVWNDTGWWEIVPESDVWSFEIDDSDISLKTDKIYSDDANTKLSDVIDAPTLFNEYPFLKKLDAVVTIDPKTTMPGGSFIPAKNKQDVSELDINIRARSEEDARRYILHEVQHAVQDHEGFASGGSPQIEAQFAKPGSNLLKLYDEYREAWRNLKTQYQDRFGIKRPGSLDSSNSEIEDWYDSVEESNAPPEVKTRFMDLLGKIENERDKEFGIIPQDIAYRKYQSLTGESEARLTEARLNMTDKQRKAEPPWETLEKMMKKEGLLQDGQKPENVLISRDGDGAAMSDIRYQAMSKAAAYEENRKNNRSIKIKAFTSFNKFKGELVKGVDKFLGSISTRLKLINQKLAEKIRTLDYDINTKYANDIKIALPLLEKAKKMTRDDYADWDFARKNSDGEKLKELNEKYGMVEEYKAVREMLDRIRKEAIEVGYEVGEIEEYWPRVLKDQEGFLKAIDRGPERPEFTDALKKKAKDMGIEVWELDPMQRADIISNMILGKYYGIPGPGSVKQRVFDTIPVEFNRFYMDSDAALMNHLHSMRKRIEARKFFGKVPEKIATAKQRLRLAETKLRETEQNDTDKISDLKSRIAEYRAIIEKYKNQNDFTENIGSYIDELIVNKEIKPEQENTVKEILTARFNERGATGNWAAYKNFSYMDTMGSPISAITQIGDLAWSMYEGGVFPTLKNAYKSILNKSRITKKDVGVERIAQEFADADTLSKAVAFVFKWVGLEKMDSIGKEALLNTAFEKYKQEAAKNPMALKQKIRPIFENETDSVIQDLLNNDVTDNVKRLVYGRLLDFQPVGLSEMPEKYLTAGNGRVFYMLKTFTLKQFDIFRREVYQDLKNGNAKQKAEAMKRFVYLSSLFVLANAGADELKDWMLGRDTELSDRVVDNVLRLFGVSKFVTWKARTEGVGSALTRQILPPFKFIDALTKDVVTAGDDKGLKTIESIPIVGKLAYWHLGRGSNNENELWDIRLNKEKARLNKVNDRLERSDNKSKFYLENRADIAERKRINKMQGKLNALRKKSNQLKKMKQTQEIEQRIEKLETARTEIIKKYFKKGTQK